MTLLQAPPPRLSVQTAPPPAGSARLIGQAGPDLQSHLAVHGRLPVPTQWGPLWGEWLLRELERSGLTGRGGAGFPAYLKALSVRRAEGQTMIVVNAMEGEPASAKDQVLLQGSPHLVLDGAQVLAAALGAVRVVICLPEQREALAARLRGAIRERGPLDLAMEGSPRSGTQLALLPGRYVTGEESALMAALSGHPGVPAWRPDKALPLAIPISRRRVAQPKALVHNAETLANVALIARYGAQWWRSVGDVEAPGTVLVTVSGDVGKRGVYEVETGTPISEILARAGAAPRLQAALVGGYGGAWIGADRLATPLSPSPLRALGASMGAGVLVALGGDACGIRETARVARWMAGESAGQCGPCLWGLPAIAGDLKEIVRGFVGSPAGTEVYQRLASRCAAVAGRGACRHPDGLVRLVESALRVFGPDLKAHLAGAPCAGASGSCVVPVPQ